MKLWKTFHSDVGRPNKNNANLLMIAGEEEDYEDNN